MKAFKLMMMAGLLAFAGTAMAQDKQAYLAVDDIKVANGETAELAIKMDFETTKEVCGINFSLYLPDGILLDGFASKDEQDAAKASALKKACEFDEDDCVWGEDADKGWLSVKQKTDGGLLFVLIDQDDKTPFVSTKAKVLNVKVKAIADVADLGKITTIGITDTDNISLDLTVLDGYEIAFGVNKETVGINDIKSADTTAPAYNLQGIRVNNAKGLIIREGKKVVVK